jgi:hypothetical protein
LLLYLLKHAHLFDPSEDEVFETKIIGIFSSKEKAEESIDKLKVMPGFKNYPEDFIIEDYEIDVMEWDGGFVEGLR